MTSSDCDLLEYRIDQLEKVTDNQTTILNNLVKDVAVLSTKVMFGAASLTGVINVIIYFLKEGVK